MSRWSWRNTGGAEGTQRTRPDPGGPAPAWPQLLIAVLLYALLQAGLSSVREAAWGQPLIDQITVQPAAGLLSWMVPAHAVQAEGPRLVWPGGALGVRSGCDALEVMLVLAVALLLAPLRWYARLAWLSVGLLTLWALNQGRVLALYAAFRFQRGWFDALHTLWLPLLLVAAAVGLYLWALHHRDPA